MILSYVCFEPASLTPAALADLIESADLGFTPETLRTNQFGKSAGLKYSTRSLDRLRGLGHVSSVSLGGGDGESFRLSGIGGWPAQVLVLESIAPPTDGFMAEATVKRGFVAALVGDSEDVFWQSADQINTFQIHGRAWEHLPKTRDETFDRDKIDISNNPGRQVAAPGMWLWAASKMWFGPGSFALIDRDRLLRLPTGSAELRVDGVVVVDLFGLSDEPSVIRRAQRDFRSWMDYDALEARRSSFADALKDPRVEFETGDFPSGASRRVIEWLNAGQLVPRSLATEYQLTELDTGGRLIAKKTLSVA